MSLKILQQKNILKNNIKSKNSIEVSFYKGKIESNLTETPASVCAIVGLDFTCEDNSQYIPVI
jgi:hypothetical protein